MFQNGKQTQSVIDSKPGVPKNMVNDKCPYCLDKGVNVIDIGCTHAFCTKCCMNLIKITKIKKGLNFSKMDSVID